MDEGAKDRGHLGTRQASLLTLWDGVGGGQEKRTEMNCQLLV